KLRVLNLRGNDVIGVPPGLLNLCQLDLFDLQLQDNPLLSLLPGEWRDRSDHLQSLQDYSAMKLFVIANQLRSFISNETSSSSKHIHKEYQLEEAQTILAYLDNVLEKFKSGSCCWCTGSRFGSGIRLRRHCVNLFAYEGLPIALNCCGLACTASASECGANDFADRFYGVQPEVVVQNGTE
ncbi:hypothetical protein PHET_01584, partial [Paragonimus heterotremus]